MSYRGVEPPRTSTLAYGDTPKHDNNWGMHANGESATMIASALGVSRATVYRVLSKAGVE